MKNQRIALPSWLLLLALAIEYAGHVGAPTQVLNYLDDRLLKKADGGWTGFDNGWSEEDFDSWDKRVTEYVKAVPKAMRATVTLAALDASRRVEVDNHEATSSRLRELLNKFQPLERDFSNFGLLCAKNDGVESVLHSMSCFNKKILAGKIDFELSNVAALAGAAVSAAEFHASKRLSAEYFPYTAVLQQIKKQPAAVLAKLPNEMEQLARAVAELPFDDAASKRQRETQIKAAHEILGMARG